METTTKSHLDPFSSKRASHQDFMKRNPSLIHIFTAKFEPSLVKSEHFAVSLRKKKKDSIIQELRAKRASALYNTTNAASHKNLSPMKIELDQVTIYFSCFHQNYRLRVCSK